MTRRGRRSYFCQRLCGLQRIFCRRRRFQAFSGLTKKADSGSQNFSPPIGGKDVAMKAPKNVRILALWIMGVALLLLPPVNMAQAKGGGWERMQGQIKIMKDLNKLKLGPEKEAALLALNQKYAKERRELAAGLKKKRGALRAALAAAPPDEGKIKGLVNAASAAQDKLLASFKMERDEAMALMTPVQQAQFILVMDNWYQEMMKGSEKNRP
jgi:Spy/CpxP family protein refolding chaperone